MYGEIVAGSLTINPACRAVTVNNKDVHLTTAEFDLLYYLAQNSGEVLSRDKIYSELRGIEYDGIDRSIDLRVSRLRRKIGDGKNHPRKIISIRGIGYLFAMEK